MNNGSSTDSETKSTMRKHRDVAITLFQAKDSRVFKSKQRQQNNNNNWLCEAEQTEAKGKGRVEMMASKTAAAEARLRTSTVQYMGGETTTGTAGEE